jgi:hypothetical protein
MSSTSGVQNFLVNVFRPVYVYDATTTLFTPKLEMSNIDTYSGNTVNVFTAAVGDGSNNCYVGKFAGNDYTAIKACSNVTAIGVGAGSNISNVSNSTFLGYQAGAAASNATSNVSLGDGTSGNGLSNVRIGSSNIGTGDRNVSIGAATTTAGFSNCILVGPGLTATQSNTFRLGTTYLYGDMGTKWLGLGTPTPIDTNSRFDVSGNAYFGKQVGIQMVPTRTLDINGDFRADDGSGTLDFTGGVTSSTNGFASVRGTINSAAINSTTSIATLKKGVILVSAQDTASTSHYESVMSYCLNPANGSASVDMTSNVQAGNVTVVFESGGSNIQISNATAVRSIAWSVTYFPLP